MKKLSFLQAYDKHIDKIKKHGFIIASVLTVGVVGSLGYQGYQDGLYALSVVTPQPIQNPTSFNSNGSATSFNSNGSATSTNSNGSATSFNSNGSATTNRSTNSNGSATSINSNGSATSFNSNGSATTNRSTNSNGSATSFNSNGSATTNRSTNSNGSATSFNSNGSATSFNSNGSATSQKNSTTPTGNDTFNSTSNRAIENITCVWDSTANKTKILWGINTAMSATKVEISYKPNQNQGSMTMAGTPNIIDRQFVVNTTSRDSQVFRLKPLNAANNMVGSEIQFVCASDKVTTPTTPTSSLLTGVYTGGDIIISEASFTQTLPNGTVGPVNTILSTGSNAPVNANITFKNIGNTPLYFDMPNQGGNIGYIPVSCQNDYVGGCNAKITISSLTKGHYLLPGQSIQGVIYNIAGGRRNSYNRNSYNNNYTLIFKVHSQQEGSSTTPIAHPQYGLFETNGQNNNFTINYKVPSTPTTGGKVGDSCGARTRVVCATGLVCQGGNSKSDTPGTCQVPSSNTGTTQKGFDLTIQDIATTYNQSKNTILYNFNLKNIGNEPYYDNTKNTSHKALVFFRKRVTASNGTQIMLTHNAVNSPDFSESSNTYNTVFSISAPFKSTQAVGASSLSNVIGSNTFSFSYNVNPLPQSLLGELPNGTYKICDEISIGAAPITGPNESPSVLVNDINTKNNSTTYCTTFTKTNGTNPPTTPTSSLLTGLYTGGDIIISEASFTQKLSNGKIGPVNTVISTKSNDYVTVNITFKNIGTKPLYLPLQDIDNTYGMLPVECQGANASNGPCEVRIDKSSLTQGRYLLAGKSVKGTTISMASDLAGKLSKNNSMFFIVSSQQQQGRNPVQPNRYRDTLFETNGRNNTFSIKYTVKSTQAPITNPNQGFDLTIQNIKSTYNQEEDRIYYSMKVKNLGKADYDVGGLSIPQAYIAYSNNNIVSPIVGYLSMVKGHQDNQNFTMQSEVLGSAVGVNNKCTTFKVGISYSSKGKDLLPGDKNINNNTVKHCTRYKRTRSIMR